MPATIGRESTNPMFACLFESSDFYRKIPVSPSPRLAMTATRTDNNHDIESVKRARAARVAVPAGRAQAAPVRGVPQRAAIRAGQRRRLAATRNRSVVTGGCAARLRSAPPGTGCRSKQLTHAAFIQASTIPGWYQPTAVPNPMAQRFQPFIVVIARLKFTNSFSSKCRRASL